MEEGGLLRVTTQKLHPNLQTVTEERLVNSPELAKQQQRRRRRRSWQEVIVAGGLTFKELL